MVAVIISVLMTTQAWGTIYTVDKNANEFGYIDQHNLDRWEGDFLANMGCAPTATMNSFIYLQNHYPGVYDHSLVPEGDGMDLIKARELAITWMGTTNAGTTIEDWTWGKHDYLENYAAGKTIFHGQSMYNNWTALRPRPDWVENVLPSWNFLYNQLTWCQDVEIGIWWQSDIGHALTLTGLTWNDELNAGTVDYVDPWTGALFTDVGINLNLEDGRLHVAYQGQNAWIDLALAESAVPEPSAFLVLGSGFVGILIRLRRRRV